MDSAKDSFRVKAINSRRRDADENGYVKCCTCSTVNHWTMMDAGHWAHRCNKATRWHESNVHAQCIGCNRYGDGQFDKHKDYIEQIHGKDVSAWLLTLAHSEVHHTQHQIDILVKVYKQKIKELHNG